jgi:type I restriction enzyme R subunit
MAWEKLFWLLKFLIPKLKIKDPNQDMLDELLDAVDLSSYGLERTKLNHSIGLDASETELEPQNPNLRGNRDGEPEKDPLDEIIRNFNERWFQGWSATPEEQRIKFINIIDSIRAHPDYPTKYKDNTDPYAREIAFEKMLQDVMLKRRKDELELYKLFASDPAFKSAWSTNIAQVLSKGLDSRA